MTGYGGAAGYRPRVRSAYYERVYVHSPRREQIEYRCCWGGWEGSGIKIQMTRSFKAGWFGLSRSTDASFDKIFEYNSWESRLSQLLTRKKKERDIKLV